MEDLAHYAGVPVWNGLTNEFHPTQILADFLTIREHFGSLKGIHFVYFGDARYNMGNSLMVGCAKMGLHFTACAPKKYQPDAALIAQCQAIAAETGATLTFEEDPAKAAQGADVLYTDVWVSMGEPIEVWAERIYDLAPYQINQELMNIAGPKAVFMHCLPAYHDHKTAVGKEMGERFGRDAMEVTDEVFEGPQSIVFDEAENRMHTIKAVMCAPSGVSRSCINGKCKVKEQQGLRMGSRNRARPYVCRHDRTPIAYRGSFVAPVCEEFGFDYSIFSYYFTATLIGLAAALPFVGKLIPKVVGKVWLPVVELILLAAGAGMAFYTEVWMFIAAGALIGVCFAFTTGVAMSDVIDQWFKKSGGLAIGLAWAVNSIYMLIMTPSSLCHRGRWLEDWLSGARWRLRRAHSPRFRPDYSL